MNAASPARVSLIVAHDEDRGIGRAGGIPWHIPGELRWVRDITLGRAASTAAPGRRNALIMGRHTYESLPENRRPLPGRMNIVLGRRRFPDTVSATSLAEALGVVAETEGMGRAFIFGGERLYAEALAARIPDELFVSIIPGTHDCDVFFP
ncbi:MAG: dihydrofolate reductase, partial [Angustibacter sp.]